MNYKCMTVKEALSDAIFDFLPVGYIPCNETSTAGSNPATNHKELCGIYIEQLIRKYGKPIGHCSYFILEYSKENVVFYEAAVLFNLNDEDAQSYAIKVQDGDEYWDSIARPQLSQFNFQI